MDVDAPLPLAERLSARQWRLVDVVLAAAFAAATVATMLTERHPTPAGSAWDSVRVTATIAVCVAVPFRRAYPVQVLGVTAVLIAGLVAIGVQGPVTGVAALATYTVAATCGRNRSLEAAALVMVAVALAALLGWGGPYWVTAVSGPAAVLIGWLAGENARTRHAYTEAVAEQAAERERVHEERVRRSAADERVRIARELHDIVAHAMSIITVRSGVARTVVDTQPEEVREALSIIEATSRQALREMRLIVGVLRTSDDSVGELGPAPGLDDLDEVIRRVGDAGVCVETRIEGTVRRLPAGITLSAYRIIQEALTNVVRHAGPTTAHLKLTYHPEELEIELIDEGPGDGFRPGGAASPVRGGNGLIGMRERVALYGGRLSTGQTGRGFRVAASLPTGGDPR